MSFFVSSPFVLSNHVIPIHTFKSVSITKRKPLVLCDIDDTVLGYDKNIDFFYDGLKKHVENVKSKAGIFNRFRSMIENVNIVNMTDDEIRFYASKMYDDYRTYNKPRHCDFGGFIELLKKVKSLDGELRFLTARGKSSAYFTKKQFSEIGLNYDDYKIHYTGNEISKGEYIQRYIDLKHYGEVVFIDDLDPFIQSVVNLCPSIQCYKFVYQPRH